MNSKDILEKVDRANGAIAEGDNSLAQAQFLSAPRGLLALAKSYDGKVRRNYLKQARSLVEQARGLSATQAA